MHLGVLLKRKGTQVTSSISHLPWCSQVNGALKPNNRLGLLNVRAVTAHARLPVSFHCASSTLAFLGLLSPCMIFTIFTQHLIAMLYP